MGLVRPRLVNLVRLLWLLLVAWYELGIFYSHTSSCLWPDTLLQTSTGSPTHVLVVADPQILDHRSYPDRPSWLTRLSQFIVDLNMRKSWRAVMRQSPQAVVFLGDMMDNGRYAMSDDEHGFYIPVIDCRYETYVRRFKNIFINNAHLPVYYIPGNHDIGLGASSPRYRFSERAVERYVSHFGPLNQRTTFGDHTVYMIDAPGLVDEDRERAAVGLSYAQWARSRPNRTVAFLQSSAQGASADPEQPILLFTHVPLSRPEGIDCGPLRERGTIREGRGLGYQNLLSAQASLLVLQSLRPAIVFSGDDHDYCEYVHTVPIPDTKRPSAPLSVPEITVKSFSIAMGIRHPGYQLLSLVPPSPNQGTRTVAHQPCLLPDQLGIYLNVYIPLVSLTLIVLLAANARRVLARHSSPTRPSGDSSSIPLASPTADSDVDFDLPPPSAWRAKTFRHSALGSRTCTFVFRGQARRVTLSLPALIGRATRFLWSSGGRESETRRRSGIGKGFVMDFVEAAWAPFTLFVAIAWWVW